jgi:hypothetical protein
VPGWRNNLVAISGSGELILKADQAPAAAEAEVKKDDTEIAVDTKADELTDNPEKPEPVTA